MTSQSPAKVGARIKKLRLAKGMSQQALAEPKFTAPYLSLIEQGQRSPSLDALGYLAHKLDVSVDEPTATTR